MKAKVALITMICCVASGCATVDFANVGGESAEQTASVRQDNKANVVERAASKLYGAFAAQGWVVNKKRKSVQSAASVLLRGLDRESVDGPLSAYAENSHSLAEIHADMTTAKDFVLQANKAAEVFLAMAPDDTNLRKELASLQKALISSREAELVFKLALKDAGFDSDEIWNDYSRTVDALRDVTDAYGDRVRAGRTLTSALQNDIN